MRYAIKDTTEKEPTVEFWLEKQSDGIELRGSVVGCCRKWGILSIDEQGISLCAFVGEELGLPLDDAGMVKVHND